MKSISYKTALGGVISALCLMLMFLTSLSPVFYLVMPMLAGMLILAVKFETDTSWAFTTYCSVSILSILTTFNIESVMMFVLFFGYYPLVKGCIDKLRFSVARVGLKFLIYNIATITEVFLGFYIFGITDMIDEMGNMGKYGLWIMLGMCNIMFIVYDIALSNCSILYNKWFRTKILCKK